MPTDAPNTDSTSPAAFSEGTLSAGKRRKRVAAIAALILVTVAGIAWLMHYLITPQVFLSSASPDGKFSCVVLAPPFDDIHTDAYIRDSSGTILKDGIW